MYINLVVTLPTSNNTKAEKISNALVQCAKARMKAEYNLPYDEQPPVYISVRNKLNGDD